MRTVFVAAALLLLTASVSSLDTGKVNSKLKRTARLSAEANNKALIAAGVSTTSKMIGFEFETTVKLDTTLDIARRVILDRKDAHNWYAQTDMGRVVEYATKPFKTQDAVAGKAAMCDSLKDMKVQMETFIADAKREIAKKPKPARFAYLGTSWNALTPASEEDLMDAVGYQPQITFGVRPDRLLPFIEKFCQIDSHWLRFKSEVCPVATALRQKLNTNAKGYKDLSKGQVGMVLFAALARCGGAASATGKFTKDSVQGKKKIRKIDAKKNGKTDEQIKEMLDEAGVGPLEAAKYAFSIMYRSHMSRVASTLTQQERAQLIDTTNDRYIVTLVDPLVASVGDCSFNGNTPGLFGTIGYKTVITGSIEHPTFADWIIKPLRGDTITSDVIQDWAVGQSIGGYNFLDPTEAIILEVRSLRGANFATYDGALKFAAVFYKWFVTTKPDIATDDAVPDFPVIPNDETRLPTLDESCA